MSYFLIYGSDHIEKFNNKKDLIKGIKNLNIVEPCFFKFPDEIFKVDLDEDEDCGHEKIIIIKGELIKPKIKNSFKIII